MQTTLSSKLLRLVAVAPIVAALAACSSDNSNSNGTSSSSSTTTNNSSSSSSSSSKTSGSSSSTSTSSSSSSSSSSAGVSDGGTDAGDGGNNSDASVTFAMVYADIISKDCVGCHHGATADAGAGGGVALGALDMSSVDAGYMNLVGVAAGGTGIPGFEDAGQKVCGAVGMDAGLLRVAPGDAGGSLLCNKVNPADVPPATPPCGDPMPLIGFPLDGGNGGLTQQAVFTEIKTWINQGAKP